MNVLLINPPMDVANPPKFVSFGIAYISQALKNNGHNVEIIDIDANRFPKETVKHLIAESKCDIIGIGGLSTVYPYLHWLVPEIRKIKPDIKIIIGGGVASALKEYCFNRLDIDYEVIGEGEVTIVELLNAIRGGELSSVKGIGYRDRGNVLYTESRPLMESLDDVPMIDDALFPMKKLLENSDGILQVHVQRGCPGRCTFCFNCFRVVSSKVRYRPVENVIEEIKFYGEKYKLKLFALAGECVTMNKKWVIEFCDRIIKDKINIEYRVTSRVDTINEEILGILKNSGCTRLSLGLETGSEKILKIMRKNATVEKGREIVRIAKKYIPNIEIAIMLGYIGEDKDTLKDTIKFCKELGIKPIILYATPFPGTELYRMAIEKKRIKEEDYLMKLDRVSILKYEYNLTDMPDEEAKKYISQATDEINRYYLYKDMISLKPLKNIISNIKTNGIGNTIAKIQKSYSSSRHTDR